MSDGDLRKQFPFLVDPALSDEIKLGLVTQHFQREAAEADRALEVRRWRSSTPLALALAGAISILLNFVFDYVRETQSSSAAQRQLNKEFQYGILETELEKDLTNAERANVLLFLVNAGVLSDLDEEYLAGLAEENLGGERRTIPSLGRNDLPSSLPDISSNREIVDLIRLLEGGCVEHPDDTGGATNAGITSEAFADYSGVDLVTTADICGLSSDEIYGFYDARYIRPSNAGGIDSMRLRAAFLSFAVNAGIGRAARMLEEVTGRPADGQLAPEDLATINARMAEEGDEFIVRFSCTLLSYYQGLGYWDTFGRGWTRRLQALTPDGDLGSCVGPDGEALIKEEPR